MSAISVSMPPAVAPETTKMPPPTPRPALAPEPPTAIVLPSGLNASAEMRITQTQNSTLSES